VEIVHLVDSQVQSGTGQSGKLFIYWTFRCKPVPDRGGNCSFTGQSGVKRYRTEGEIVHLLDSQV
jgi:hypothetical protein